MRGEILTQVSSGRLLVCVDGSLQQDLRLLLRSDDDVLTLMTYPEGSLCFAEVSERIARGEQVAPSDYYLRTATFLNRNTPGRTKS
jgi:hypothetical protein